MTTNRNLLGPVKNLAYYSFASLEVDAGSLGWENGFSSTLLKTMAEQGSRSIDSDSTSTNAWNWDDASVASSEPSAGSGSVTVSGNPSSG
jgi:hypothetical protein